MKSEKDQGDYENRIGACLAKLATLKPPQSYSLQQQVSDFKAKYEEHLKTTAAERQKDLKEITSVEVGVLNLSTSDTHAIKRQIEYQVKNKADELEECQAAIIQKCSESLGESLQKCLQSQRNSQSAMQLLNKFPNKLVEKMRKGQNSLQQQMSSLPLPLTMGDIKTKMDEFIRIVREEKEEAGSTAQLSMHEIQRLKNEFASLVKVEKQRQSKMFIKMSEYLESIFSFAQKE